MQHMNMFYGAPPHIFEKARELRKNMTEAEEILWKYLKKKQLDNCKFRRQHPISEFVADFYCHSTKLVIEVDGGSHNLKERKFADSERTRIMNTFGIKVLRFYNSQVINNVDEVVEIIKVSLDKRASTSPL